MVRTCTSLLLFEEDGTYLNIAVKTVTETLWETAKGAFTMLEWCPSLLCKLLVIVINEATQCKFCNGSRGEFSNNIEVKVVGQNKIKLILG